jgi:hypothetical protein
MVADQARDWRCVLGQQIRFERDLSEVGHGGKRSEEGGPLLVVSCQLTGVRALLDGQCQLGGLILTFFDRRYV